MMWLGMAMLIGVAGMLLVAPLWRPGASRHISREQVNQDIVAERLAQLYQANVKAEMAPPEWEQIQQQAALDLLETDDQPPLPKPARRPWALSVVLLMLLAAAAVGLYWHWGEPEAWQPRSAVERSLPPTLNSPEKVITRLNAVLAEHPNDAQGWQLLGKLYYSQQQFAESAHAFARARTLNPADVDLQLQYLQARFIVDGNRFTPETQRLADAIVQQHPQQPLIENLVALDRFSRGEYAAAIEQWRGILATLPPESDEAAMVERAILETKQRQMASGAELRVQLTVAPSLRAQISGTETLFVIVRPLGQSSGPPLAVLKQPLPVPAWPYTVTLSQADVMLPGQRLEDYSAVEVVARISRSGQPRPQDGDLQGQVMLRNWLQPEQAPATLTIDAPVAAKP